MDFIGGGVQFRWNSFGSIGTLSNYYPKIQGTHTNVNATKKSKLQNIFLCHEFQQKTRTQLITCPLHLSFWKRRKKKLAI